MCPILPVLVVLGWPAPPGDLAEAEVALARSWGRICAQGLAESASFELKVDAIDPALGGGYFPGAPPPPTRPGEPGDVRPLARWTDAVSTRGDRWRCTAELFLAGPGARPMTRGTIADGRQSWICWPDERRAMRHPGAPAVARWAFGYYRDMVGIGDPSPAATRSTPGDGGEPFRLDLLIPSGRYEVAGSAVVDGLACVVVARPGLDKLWLVPGRGWALARREWRWSPGGPLKRRIENRDFRAIAPDFWLPFAASMEIFGTPATRPGRRVGLLKATVRAAALGVDPRRFEPDFPAGTIITDGETGDETRIGPPPGPGGRTAIQIRPVFRPTPRWRRPGVIWGAAAAVAALGLTGIVRRSLPGRSRPASPATIERRHR